MPVIVGRLRRLTRETPHDQLVPIVGHVGHTKICAIGAPGRWLENRLAPRRSVFRRVRPLAALRQPLGEVDAFSENVHVVS